MDIDTLKRYVKCFIHSLEKEEDPIQRKRILKNIDIFTDSIRMLQKTNTSTEI